jgi:hypothetical protein
VHNTNSERRRYLQHLCGVETMVDLCNADENPKAGEFPTKIMIRAAEIHNAGSERNQL